MELGARYLPLARLAATDDVRGGAERDESPAGVASAAAADGKTVSAAAAAAAGDGSLLSGGGDDAALTADGVLTAKIAREFGRCGGGGGGGGGLVGR